jgi:hypothetical protein
MIVKRIFNVLALMTMAVLSLAQEVFVTPSNHNGWTFAVVGPNKTPSARWYIGHNQGVSHIGNGSMWLYTGDNDSVVYARNTNLKGIKVSDIGKLRYRTYTSGVLKNIAPQLVLRIDITGDGKGDVSLFHEPSFQGNIPRNQWFEWNTLSGRWWCDKNGINDLKTLDSWLREYNTNAVVDYLQIQAGTWADPNSAWGRSWLGVDIIHSVVGLGQDLIYNFEPDPVSPPQTQKPIAKPIGDTIIVNPFIVVNPIVINNPVYYIDMGKKVNQKLDIEGVDDSKPKKDTPEQDPYKTDDNMFVPLLFSGNTNITNILSQIGAIGNPDQQLTAGGAFKFGGVPFYIPKGRNNVWDALAYKDEAEHKLTVKAGLQGAIEVHTIMNLTVWGKEKAGLFIEFRGSAGAYHKVDLVPDRDVRDWHKRDNDNIVSPSHVVWSRPINTHNGHQPCEVRLDSQFFKLPDDFAKQELTSVTIVDQGNKKSHRVFVVGVTVKIKVK